jgi:hypothetical protein
VELIRWVPRAKLPRLETRGGHCYKFSTGRKQNLKAHSVHMTVRDLKNGFMQNIGLLSILSLGGVRYKALPMHFLVRFLEAPTLCAPREKPCSHLPTLRQNITRFVDEGNRTREWNIMRIMREMYWTPSCWFLALTPTKHQYFRLLLRLRYRQINLQEHKIEAVWKLVFFSLW